MKHQKIQTDFIGADQTSAAGSDGPEQSLPSRDVALLLADSAFAANADRKNWQYCSTLLVSVVVRNFYLSIHLLFPFCACVILFFLKRSDLRQWHIFLFFKECEEFLRLLA